MRRDTISSLSYSRTADKDKEESVRKSGEKTDGYVELFKLMLGHGWMHATVLWFSSSVCQSSSFFSPFSEMVILI